MPNPWKLGGTTLSVALGAVALCACNKDPEPVQTAPAPPQTPPIPAASATIKKPDTVAAAPTGVGHTTPGPAFCKMITPQDIAGLLGVTALQPPDVQGDPPVTACMYSDGRNPMAVTLRFETGRDLAQFAQIRKSHDDNGQPTKDLPGVGDAAASYSLGNINGITFLYRGTVVLINAHAPLEKVVRLGRVLMLKM